ncbi:Crp/Fnr family transcriptional regulator [Magnetospira thiophila]
MKNTPLDMADLASTLARVREVPVFSKAPGPSLGFLLEQASLCHLEAGECLIGRGSVPDSVHVLLRGHVGMFEGETRQNDYLVDLMPAPQMIGLSEALLGEPYGHSFFAADEVESLALPVDRLLALISTNPHLLQSMIGALSLRLHALVSQVNMLKTKRADQRLAEHLLGLMRENRGAESFDLPYDKKTLAAHLGIAPESLSRSISKLRKMGVSMDGKRVSIADAAVLEDYLFESVKV